MIRRTEEDSRPSTAPALHHLFLYQEPSLPIPLSLIGSSQLWDKHFPYLYPSTQILDITSTLIAYEDGTDRKYRNVGTKSSDAGRLPKKHNKAFNTRRNFEIKINVTFHFMWPNNVFNDCRYRNKESSSTTTVHLTDPCHGSHCRLLTEEILVWFQAIPCGVCGEWMDNGISVYIVFPCHYQHTGAPYTYFVHLSLKRRTAICILTRLRTGSYSSRGKAFVSSLKRPHQLWGPLCPLFSKLLFQDSSCQFVRLTTHLNLVQRLRIHGAIPPLYMV